jgi:hypothetical protein
MEPNNQKKDKTEQKKVIVVKTASEVKKEMVDKILSDEKNDIIRLAAEEEARIIVEKRKNLLIKAYYSVEDLRKQEKILSNSKDLVTTSFQLPENFTDPINDAVKVRVINQEKFDKLVKVREKIQRLNTAIEAAIENKINTSHWKSLEDLIGNNETNNENNKS